MFEGIKCWDTIRVTALPVPQAVKRSCLLVVEIKEKKDSQLGKEMWVQDELVLSNGSSLVKSPEGCWVLDGDSVYVKIMARKHF